MTDKEKIAKIKALIESVHDYASNPIILTSRNVLALCGRIMEIVEK